MIQLIMSDEKKALFVAKSFTEIISHTLRAEERHCLQDPLRATEGTKAVAFKLSSYNFVAIISTI